MLFRQTISQDPSADLVHFFNTVICNAPQKFAYDSWIEYLCQLSDFYYMLAAILNKAETQQREGGVSETKVLMVQWCRERLTASARESINAFIGLNEFSSLEKELVERRLSYADESAISEDIAHGSSGASLSSLGSALSVLQECLECENVSMDDAQATVHRLENVFGSTDTDQDETKISNEVVATVTLLLSQFIMRLDAIAPKLLLKRGVSGVFERLYQYFDSICLANVQYQQLGPSKISFYFEYHRCLAAEKGTIVFLSDLFAEYFQFNQLQLEANDKYNCLLIDNENIGKTESTIHRTDSSMQSYAVNIANLLQALAIQHNIVLVGIGFGALLAIELAKLLSPKTVLVAIDLPVRCLTNTEEVQYREIARVLTLLNCHGIGWLSFSERQILRGYLDSYYADTAVNNKIMEDITTHWYWPINRQSPTKLLRSYLLQIEVMQAYLKLNQLGADLGFFSKIEKKLIVNTKQGGGVIKNVMGDIMQHSNILPARFVSLQHQGRIIIEKDCEPLWDIIDKFLQNSSRN